jgi:hypothetical protein
MLDQFAGSGRRREVLGTVELVSSALGRDLGKPHAQGYQAAR